MGDSSPEQPLPLPKTKQWYARLRATLERSLVPLTFVGIVLSVVVAADSVLRLLRAGENTLGIAVSLFTLAGTFVQPAFSRLEKVILSDTVRLRVNPLRAIFLVQLLVLVLLILGRVTLFSSLIDERISQGLNQDAVIPAQQALYDAEGLGGNVASAIRAELARTLTRPATLESTIRAQMLAELYVTFASGTDKQTSDFSKDVLTAACEAAFENRRLEAERAALVLSIIDPQIAKLLAEDLNDAAALAMVGTPSATVGDTVCAHIFSEYDLPRARTYLEVIRVLDTQVDTGRSNRSKSISRYNLGILREMSDFTADGSEPASVAYREAIDLYPGNLEARYQLSQLLLRPRPGDTQAAVELRLYEAVAVAHQGWNDFISTVDCTGSQNSANTTLNEDAYFCFALLTSEAAARMERIERNIPQISDSPRYIRTLLENATTLAEANNQFKPAFSTSQAYYILLRLIIHDGGEIVAGDPTVCAAALAVIRNRDQSDPEHVAWAEIASQLRTQYDCS